LAERGDRGERVVRHDGDGGSEGGDDASGVGSGGSPVSNHANDFPLTAAVPSDADRRSERAGSRVTIAEMSTRRCGRD
jgi:hypothetical protein